MKIIETEDGTIIDLFVKPNSLKFKVTVCENEIVVFCTEQPVKGRVNKELVKAFSKLFHAKITLISGFNSKQKRLVIKGVTKREVEQILLAK